MRSLDPFSLDFSSQW